MAQDTTTADQIEDPFQIVEEDTATFTALDTTLIPIPELRDDKDTLAILPPGKPFFNYDLDIKNLQRKEKYLRVMQLKSQQMHNGNGMFLRLFPKKIRNFF